MSTQRTVLFAAIVAFTYGAASNAAWADIELPDWTTVTFSGASSLSEHPYYPLDPGTFSVYEGTIENGVVERIETFVTFETKTILGVETRVIRDMTFKGGVLVEVAFDFAIVNGVGATVNTPAGSFDNVLSTSEDNLFDGPDIAENKYYALDNGQVLIELLDHKGRPEFAIPFISQTLVSCLGDIDHDRIVSASDLAALLGASGEDDFFADLDKSGEVDAIDLAIVLANWGQCTP